MRDLSVLSKEICMRCVNEVFSGEWTKFDEDRWNKGFIYCSMSWYNEDELPPSKCPYHLEHMLATQKESLYKGK